MKVLLVYWHNSGPVWHRLIVPFDALLRQGVDVQYVKSLDDLTYADFDVLKQFDVVVFNRNISPRSKPHEVFSVLREAGIKIVIDMDDTWGVTKYHILSKSYKSSGMDLCIKYQVQFADEVWASTKYLAGELRGLNKNIHVVHNAIDPEKMPLTGNSLTDKHFWAGGTTHGKDLELISDLPITIVGPVKQDDGTYPDFWIETFKKMPNITIEDGIVEIHRYHELFLDKGISLAPLVDDFFTRCKSNLKMLEAGWYSKPIIVSDVVPYLRTGKEDVTHLVARNKSEFASKFKRLSLSRDWQEQLAGRLHELVAGRYHIDRANEIRMDRLNKLVYGTKRKFKETVN